MESWVSAWSRLWTDDALAAFRDRIAVQLSVFSAVLLLPFTINHFIAGRHLLGLGILTAQILLALNGHSLRRQRPLLVPFWITVLGFECAIVAAVIIQGVHSAVWAFPALFIGYFVLPRRQAHGFGLFLLLAVSAAMLHIAGPAGAVRLFAAMALTLAMINVVLGVIGELQQALLRQAHTDPLTGAWNRRYFDEQLAQIAAPPSTTSRPSTTATATPPATPCCRPWCGWCASASARPTCCSAPAARNSCCCCRARGWTTPRAWPSSCAS